MSRLQDKRILDGEDAKSDRSNSLATVIAEVQGWVNWCTHNNIPINGTTDELIMEAGQHHHVAYRIEVGGRIIDVLTGFMGIVTQIYDDNVVYFCKEMRRMIRCVHSVVALS